MLQRYDWGQVLEENDAELYGLDDDCDDRILVQIGILYSYILQQMQGKQFSLLIPRDLHYACKLHVFARNYC